MIPRQRRNDSNLALTETQRPINQNTFFGIPVQTSLEREDSFNIEDSQQMRDDVEEYDMSSFREEEKENNTECNVRDSTLFNHPYSHSHRYWTGKVQKLNTSNTFLLNQDEEGQHKINNQKYRYEYSDGCNQLLSNNYVKIGSSSKSRFSSKVYSAIYS